MDDYKDRVYSQHEDELKEYHSEHCAEGVLDDQLDDHFQEWWGDLSEQDVRDMFDYQ